MQNGKHLAAASLDWNNNKRQLSLNHVAFTECLGLAPLKSKVQVALAVQVWIPDFFTYFIAPFLSLQPQEVLNLVVFGMHV